MSRSCRPQAAATGTRRTVRRWACALGFWAVAVAACLVRADEPLAPTAAARPFADSIWIGDDLVVELLPFGLLWEPPIANQREPRCYVKYTNLHGDGTCDTAVGTEFALGRLGPAAHPEEGLQLDLLAAGFMRFGEGQDLVCADYRVGCPFTFAAQGWQVKLGYEHTSSHTADVWLNDWRLNGIARGEPPPTHKMVRDEIVFGLARRFAGQVRLYGQFGYSFATNDRSIPNDEFRYDWGLEWTPPAPAGRRGAPFAALDMDLRDEQGFTTNLTVEVGWQWRVAEGRSSAARVAAEYYNGKSPFGQFLNRRENWWALALSYDW